MGGDFTRVEILQVKGRGVAAGLFAERGGSALRKSMQEG